jgi:type IV secretory pathway TraG/TraD family ATPase VirD4
MTTNERTAIRTVTLLLDEAANSAPLTKLPQYAATLRSRDVQVVTIFQDYGQVVRRWGRDNARSILNNHVARVLLPGMATPSCWRSSPPSPANGRPSVPR